MPHIEVQTQRDIAVFLPEALKTALESYMKFSKNPHHTDDNNHAKNFKDHHDACKVALAHIKLLIELARQIGSDPQLESEMEQAQLAAIIDRAREELNSK